MCVMIGKKGKKSSQKTNVIEKMKELKVKKTILVLNRLIRQTKIQSFQ